MHLVDSLPQALLQSRSDAIVATGPQGLIQFWNPGAVRIFGFSSQEAVGRSLDLIIPDNLRARHWQGYDRVMATGHSRYGEGELLSVPALTKEGRRISVEFTIAMLTDALGERIGMAAIMRDVTLRFEEMKAAQRDLAALKAELGRRPPGRDRS
jgi:PAS domain S-box-containing protein